MTFIFVTMKHTSYFDHLHTYTRHFCHEWILIIFGMVNLCKIQAEVTLVPLELRLVGLKAVLDKVVLKICNVPTRI
jgi:hypothetical protein